MKLNPEQEAVVKAPDGPVLVLAGAGSGKTRTIVHRIGHLIAARGIAPHRILAVTFTNKAAEELKQRLSALIGDDQGGVLAGTFHAISLRFLRRFADRLGYPKEFHVLDADEQLALVKQVLKARGISAERLHPSYARYWIEQCKHQGLLPSQAPEEDWNGVGLREIYATYQEELLRMGRMDFSDLLLNFVRLLREHEDVGALIRSRFDHVLVDEYQDTNPIQHEWLWELCREHGNITVVGDDDQSIYGWRGADVRGILEFERRWPGARVFKLERNYRSTHPILALANHVIAANHARRPKRLVAERKGGEKPVLRACADEHDEARAVVAFLQQNRQRGVPWEEMAVLYRSHRQSLPLEQVLREAAIPYRVLGGVGFFERMEIKDALALWALVNEVADFAHLARVANKPRRGVGPKTLEEIARIAAERGLSASKLLALARTPGAPKALAKLRDLAEAVEQARHQGAEKPDAGLWAVLEASGYLELLRAEGEAEFAAREENLRALQAFVEELLEQGVPPVEVLDRVALLTAPEEQSAARDAGVQLMTLHRAKGLEFAAVAIVGVEEGLLPHQRALDEGEDAIAEERRLFYVGITRAKDRLLLTYARVRRWFGDLIFPKRSRFLDEATEDLLAVEGEQAPSAAPSPGGVREGARVLHPSFGLGTLLSCEGQGEEARVVVSFDRAGVKRLIWKYARLTVLD